MRARGCPLQVGFALPARLQPSVDGVRAAIVHVLRGALPARLQPRVDGGRAAVFHVLRGAAVRKGVARRLERVRSGHVRFIPLH